MYAIQILRCSCGAAASKRSGDEKRYEADRDDEDNAEDDDDTSFLTSPVVSFDQLAGSFAYLKSGDSGHFEY